MKILQREAKRRRESSEAFRDAGRAELAAQEEAELVVVEGYLPKQLSDEEVAAWCPRRWPESTRVALGHGSGDEGGYRGGRGAVSTASAFPLRYDGS